MTRWQQHRQILIALTFASICITLGRISLDPSAGKRSLATFNFPSVVPLPGWQLLESFPLAKPLPSPYKFSAIVLSSQKYLYKRDKHQMEIAMQYEASASGELQDYFLRWTSVELPQAKQLQFRQQPGIGFYSLFVHKGRSHLATCINPQGNSTVTKEQFLANRYTYDFQLQRLLSWLIGESSLPDKRCLWVHLSVPLKQGSVEATYPVLEQAWQPWFRWWRDRFPKY